MEPRVNEFQNSSWLFKLEFELNYCNLVDRQTVFAQHLWIIALVLIKISGKFILLNPLDVMGAEDIVIHAFPSYGGSISVSPFPIRVEMFLRWAKIPYTVTTKSPTHPHTKKSPWVEYKG